MTTENYQHLLAEEIRRLEDEFRSRRDSGRRMSRSVAAAYRKSIELRAVQLKNLDHNTTAEPKNCWPSPAANV